MYRIVVLVLCCHVLSQPVSNEAARHARELIECCPCPPRDGERQAGSARAAAAAGDDCPCRARGADSEGASSLFFPAALHPDGSRLSSTDTKEDPKNLLEPEVALATSVLDTLREATEEGYQDALAREAARNAAEPDALPEESARNVVIVVSPSDANNSDEFMSAASHIQESRCIHPLGSTPLDRMRSTENSIKLIPESFKFPTYKHFQLPHKNLLQFDSNTGASEVKESVVNTNEFLPNFNPEKHEMPRNNNVNRENNEFRLIKPNILKLKKFGENNPDSFKLSLVPQVKSRENDYEDLDSATTNIQHQIESTTDKMSQLFKYDKLPTNVRNLLKLRDVELIPKSIRNKFKEKPKLDVSKFSLPTLLKFNPNDNFKPEAKSSSNEPCSLENDPSKQKNIDDINISDNISGNISTENEDQLQLQNTEINPILNKNSNAGNKNEATDKGDINMDILASSSQIKTPIIRTDLKNDPGAAVLSQSVPDCNFKDLKESDLDIKPKQVLDDSQDIIVDSPNFEGINKVMEENIHDSNTQSQDADTESSNNILLTQVPFENQNEIIRKSPLTLQSTDIDSESVANLDLGHNFAETLENRNMNPHVEEPLRETLSDLRENLENNFSKKLNKSELLRALSNKDNTKIEDDGALNTDDDVNQLATTLDSDNTANSETAENLTNISLNDLQNMSDKLLVSNSNNQSDNYFIHSTTSDIVDDTNFKSNVKNSKGDNELLDTKSNSIDPVLLREDNLEKNACPTNSDTKTTHMNEKNTIKSANHDKEHKDMDTGASDTVINTLPGILDPLNSNLRLRTPLLTDILQPTSDPLKLLGKPLANVLSLNTNLPTLDDLRERLANIFNRDDGSVENDSASLETDFTNDSPQEVMATEASTKNSQRELPLLNQLGALSNDMVQKKSKVLNPFDSLTKPRLSDLSSYRAHLPSPSSLDLKPIKIEPKLRNRIEKKPLINFGSDRTLQRKVEPSSTLANPLDGIPTLEELRNFLRANTRSLMKNPIRSDFNSLHENLRAHDIDDLGKNIQLNTQRTLKGIQRKMNSSLRKPNMRNSLGDSLANPQDLLDDMNDKLKGIQYDLNDRLSSLRENILESSGISNIVEKPAKAGNRNVMSNLRKSKTKPSSRIQTAASTTANQEVKPHLLGLEPRNFVHPNWSTSRKTQTAAESAPTITTAPMPPLSYLHRTVPFRQNPMATDLLKERTPITPVSKDITHFNDKSPLFKSVNPFDRQSHGNKVTISFGTTTARPPSPPFIGVPNKSVSKFHKFDSSINSPGNDATYKNTAAVNSALSSGKLNTFRNSAPVPSPIDEDYEDTLDNFPNEELPLTDTKLKSSVLREMPKPNNLKIHSNSRNFKSANMFDDVEENHKSKTALKTIGQPRWPKITENNFLSKTRDVDANRHLVKIPEPVKEIRTEQLDMLRSPTENSDVIIDEPLKENVSYRCRMVCTKEIK